MMQQPADDNLLKPEKTLNTRGMPCLKISKEKNSLFEYTYTLLISLLNYYVKQSRRSGK
jgi:hypothetical protein